MTTAFVVATQLEQPSNARSLLHNLTRQTVMMSDPRDYEDGVRAQESDKGQADSHKRKISHTLTVQPFLRTQSHA